jgi:hypothetical protein
MLSSLFETLARRYGLQAEGQKDVDEELLR